MKKLIIIFLTAIFILSIAGCVTPITEQDISTAKVEQLPDNYKEGIKLFMETRLKDPDSAKYIFHNPKKGYHREDRIISMIVPVEINAKNSYGGYTGYKAYYFTYVNGECWNVTYRTESDYIHLLE